MSVIKFDVIIKGKKITTSLNLEGQDLYFFNQREEQGKIRWIKSYLEGVMKIENITID